jgi:putative SOS response-associated peptidase YedK
MPVILTAEQEWDAWLTGQIEEAIALQRPLPSELLRIVATGEKSDSMPGVAA